MTLDKLLEHAQAHRLTDEQRIEQAFGQLALTAHWRGRPLGDLADLKAQLRKLAGVK